jgi:hypothetical protein
VQVFLGVFAGMVFNSSMRDFQSFGEGAIPSIRFWYNKRMSYHFAGNFQGMPADIVIREARKQKQAESAVSAILNPLNFVVKNGAKVVTGSSPHVVSEEQYIKAIILKTLEENGLAPLSGLERTIRKVVVDVMKENGLITPHPHWNSGLRRKK